MGNISHYFGLTTFVQWMDSDPADAPSRRTIQDTTQTVVVADVRKEACNSSSGRSNNKQRTVEFSVPLTTTNPPLMEALPTAGHGTQGTDEFLLDNNRVDERNTHVEEAPGISDVLSDNSRAKTNTEA